MTSAATSHPGREGSASDAPTAAEALVEAICTRDFAGLEALLSSDARLRGVLPPRMLEADGPAEILGWFRRWYEGAETFEVLDRTIDDVAGRTRASWRIGVTPHPVNGDPARHVIEQIVFCDASDGRIDQIDLLCSGFRPQGSPPATA